MMWVCSLDYKELVTGTMAAVTSVGSSEDLDPHLTCVSCFGVDCYFDLRCDLYQDRSDEYMKAYVDYRKKLARKRDQKKARAAKADPFCTTCTSAGVVEENPLRGDLLMAEGIANLDSGVF